MITVQLFFRYTTLLLLITLTGCAFTPWPKSAVSGNTPEERVESAKQHAEITPDSVDTRKDLYLTKEKSVNALLIEANDALLNQQLDTALGLYQRVRDLSPDHHQANAGIAKINQMKQHIDQIADAETKFKEDQYNEAKRIVHQVLIENPHFPPALVLDGKLKQSEQGAYIEVPSLKPSIQKPISLEFRDADIKLIFEALTRVTGINFILDKDIKPFTKATVFIKNATVEDAINMVLASNGLLKKNLTSNSALVYPSTSAKNKDYQELMMRSFYLANTTAARVASMLKAVLKVKDMYVDDRINMLSLRDTPEVIRLAEKLITANDLPDPEVMLELEVIEINRSRLQELGIIYPSQLSVATGSTMTLDALLNDINKKSTVVTSYNGINPSVNFKKTTGDINILSNPRLRIRNNEKAKIAVGDKIPLITTTIVSGSATSSSQSVQYLDVGLKLELEPRITIDNYVNIKLGLEVNALGNQVTTINGAPVYQIGSRNADTILRLKDGETQVLGGLISDDERKNTNQLPGLGDIPVIGRLFSNNQKTKQKTEIVLVITPHIISNISRPKADVTEYWSGTESVVSDKPQTYAPVSNSGVSSALDTVPDKTEKTLSPALDVPGESFDNENGSSSSKAATDSATAKKSTSSDDTAQKQITVTPNPTTQPAEATTTNINTMSKPIDSVNLNNSKAGQ
jgi:general secretion pathway protein D